MSECSRQLKLTLEVPPTTTELTCLHEDVFFHPCLVKQDLKEKRLSIASCPVSVMAVLCCDFVIPEGDGKVDPPISYPVPFLSCLSLLHTHSNLLSAGIQKGMALKIRLGSSVSNCKFILGLQA